MKISIYSFHLIFLLFIALFTNRVAAQTEPAWRELPNSPGHTFRHDDIYFVDENIGWVVNGSGQIFKSSDGGETWKHQFTKPEAYFRCVGFVDSLKGWAGNLGPGCFSPTTTEPALLYETTDGGETWAAVIDIPDPKPSGLCGISVVNDTVVYAAGTICGNPGVIKTTDAGATWSGFDLSAHADRLVDCYFFSPDSGFVVGGIGEPSESKGAILFTANGGETWQENFRTTNIPVWCWKISFPTTITGYVSLETPRAANVNNTFFLKTTDSGKTWEEKNFLSLDTFYWEQGLGFATELIGWIGGDSQSYETRDGGETWEVAGFGVNLNRVRMLSDSMGYAVGQKVYKYSVQSIVSVSTAEGELPFNYNLEQNYPNPFNPGTTISYSVPISGHVTLRIYNVIGQEIRTLIDEAHSPGANSVSWDGRDNAGINVGSGVYIYRIEVGNFVGYRKMLLVR